MAGLAVGVAPSATPASAVPSLGLSSVSTSYLGEIDVPVTLNSRTSAPRVAVFDYDPATLRFVGVLSNLATAASRLASSARADTVTVRLSGPVTLSLAPSTLYYLRFDAVGATASTSTVRLARIVAGGRWHPEVRTATVTLDHGWQNIGPRDINTGTLLHADQSGTVADVAVAPSDSSIIYLASGQTPPVSGIAGYPGVRGFGGLYRSSDAGHTWSMVDLGLAATDVTTVAVSPTNANEVVVEVEGPTPLTGSIDKSMNGGATWQATYPAGGYGLQLVGATLYATTFGALLSSSDFGTTWRVVHAFPGLILSTATVSPDGSVILAGVWHASSQYLTGVASDYAQIVESTDGGVTFRPVFTVAATQLPDPSISQIVIDPHQPSLWLAVTSNPYIGREDGYPSLYESLDAGATWTLIDTAAHGFPVGSPIQYVAVDPLSPYDIYAGINGWIYTSSDGGATFHVIPNFFFDIRRIVFAGPGDGLMYVGTDQGLYVSPDRGVTFTPLNDRNASLIYDIAVDGSRIITTVQDMSPVSSADGGATWGVTQVGELGLVAVDPYDASTVLLWTEPHVTNFFWISHDGGATWAVPTIDETQMATTAVWTQSAIAFAKTGAIYLAGGAGVFRSVDGGNTWTLLPGSPANAQAVAVSPSDPSTLYAGNWFGVNVSHDAGATWTHQGNATVNSLSVDPTNSLDLVGVNYQPSASPATFGMTLNGYLVLSHDGGVTWTNTSMTSVDYFADFPQVTRASPTSPLLVYTCEEGVYASTDRGTTWVDMSQNLPVRAVTAFTMAPDGTAYISTFGAGVWTYPDFARAVATAVAR